jgi:hypothetical protein
MTITKIVELHQCEDCATLTEHPTHCERHQR